ncbi:MAG TPA: porin family protein [Fodinibius sp.]|nr:porin family protein [Fodinibius sp.]
MLFTFLFSSAAEAQSVQDPPLHWGLKGGVNIATMYGDEVHDADVRAGFTGGLFLNYRFTPNWSIQPEVLFSMKGADLDQGLTGEDGGADYEIGYLEIPILAKYTFTTNSMVKPYLNAGPQIGFALWGDSNGRDLDDDQLKDAEFALAMGGGIDLAVASSPEDFIQTVGLDLRYTLGLTDAFDVSGDPEARNHAFLAAITVGF